MSDDVEIIPIKKEKPYCEMVIGGKMFFCVMYMHQTQRWKYFFLLLFKWPDRNWERIILMGDFNTVFSRMD